MKNFIFIIYTILISVWYNTLNANNDCCYSHFIGEYFGGGIIYHLWKDENNVEHGLIVSLKDVTKFVWSNIDNTEIGKPSKSTWNGKKNSQAIINQKGHRKSASEICLELIENNFDDWYLPSIDELILLFNSRYEVNKALSKIEGANELNNDDSYWSSNESKKSLAWHFMFNSGHAFDSSKSSIYTVRAIRSF
jgi:hypothetical protein